MDLVIEALEYLKLLPFELWGVAILSGWTLWALYFRFVTVGKHISLPIAVFEDALLISERPNSASASHVWKCEAQPVPASAQLLKESQPSGEGAPSETHWKFRDLAIAYVLFRAMGYAVLGTAFIFFFIAGAVGIFMVAQPKADVSMASVASLFATLSLLPLAIFIGLSLMKVLTAVHKLPVPCIKGRRHRDIILLGW